MRQERDSHLKTISGDTQHLPGSTRKMQHSSKWNPTRPGNNDRSDISHCKLLLCCHHGLKTHSVEMLRRSHEATVKEMQGCEASDPINAFALDIQSVAILPNETLQRIHTWGAMPEKRHIQRTRLYTPQANIAVLRSMRHLDPRSKFLVSIASDCPLL